jgi:hypothetical protein
LFAWLTALTDCPSASVRVIAFFLCIHHLTPAAGVYITGPPNGDNFAVCALYLVTHTVLLAVRRKHIKRAFYNGVAAKYITNFKF